MSGLKQVPGTFPIQSYLAAGRMLTQSASNPIVDSTRQYAQMTGVGLALHPCSQSPVAVRFKGGRSDSGAIVLTPGQKIITGPFTEFEWGLPFGWLGGGTVVLYVIPDERAEVRFSNVRPAIVFHRLRVTIVGGNVDNAPTINFPLAFPWSNGVRVSGGNQPQQVAPLFMIDPDIALLALNTVIAGPTVLTVQIRNCDPFDLNSPPDQVAGYANQNHYFDVTFNPAANGQNAVAWLPREVHLLGGDFAAFSILDPGVGAPLAGATVDVVRYGRIG